MNLHLKLQIFVDVQSLWFVYHDSLFYNYTLKGLEKERELELVEIQSVPLSHQIKYK